MSPTVRRPLTAVMSLGLVLALSAEGAIAVDAAGAETPVARTPVDFTLPERIHGVEHGRFRTRLGPVRWARLSGTPSQLPMDIEWLMPVPGGYAVLAGQDRAPRGQAVPEFLWFSPDLIRWSRRGLPEEADEASLTRVGDRYWLVTMLSSEVCCANEGHRLWVSDDAATWTELELDPGTRPQPTDLD